MNITVQDLFKNVKKYRYNNLLEFLVKEYPNGFQSNIDIFVDNIRIDEISHETLDINIKDKEVLILLTPNGGGIAAIIGKIILTAAVTVIGAAIARSNMPDISNIPSIANPDNKNVTAKDSSVYSLNSTQNEAKRGECIPVIYGTVRSYPILITPPYYRYDENDEYLYQTMIFGNGDLNVNQIFLSDTPILDIPSSDFKYRVFYDTDYDDLPTFDPNYVELVKTLPSPNNLELRGTPGQMTMNLSFDDNSNITFHPYDNGVPVDLSSLSSGSIISISGTRNNDGTYTVVSVDITNSVVTVQEATVIEPSYDFTLRPNTDNMTDDCSNGLTNMRTTEPYNNFRVGDKVRIQGQTLCSTAPYDFEAYIKTLTIDLSNTWTVMNAGSRSNYNFNACPGMRTCEYLSSVTNAITSLQTKAQVEMETSYGPYRFDEATRTGTPLEYLEIDIQLPSGLYTIDSSGNYVDRTVEFSFTLCHTDLDGNLLGCVTKTESITDSDIGQIRRTYRYPVSDIPFANQVGQYYVQINRITPEPVDYRSQDKIYVNRVKGLYGFSDKSKWPKMTGIVTKIRASNAVSALSSFQVNAFVSNTIQTTEDIVKDLYSNDYYGANLDVNDIVFEDVSDFQDVINIALDSKMTVMDAIDTVLASTKSYAFPYGSELWVRKRKDRLSSYLWNETNTFDSKMSFHFRDQDFDSIEIKYFDINDMWVEKSVRYPDTGLYPKIVNVPGVTDYQKALDLAVLSWKEVMYQRKTINFTTDIQGYLPMLLDRFTYSSNLFDTGVAGFITNRIDHKDVNGNVTSTILTLDCDFDLLSNTSDKYNWNCDAVLGCSDVSSCFPDNHQEHDFYDTIIFRNRDGSVSDYFTFTIVDVNKIEINQVIPEWVKVYPDSDNTAFSIGGLEEVPEDFIVTYVRPNDKGIEVEAVNYDSRIYDVSP